MLLPIAFGCLRSTSQSIVLVELGDRQAVLSGSETLAQSSHKQSSQYLLRSGYDDELSTGTFGWNRDFASGHDISPSSGKLLVRRLIHDTNYQLPPPPVLTY